MDTTKEQQEQERIKDNIAIAYLSGAITAQQADDALTALGEQWEGAGL